MCVCERERGGGVYVTVSDRSLSDVLEQVEQIIKPIYDDLLIHFHDWFCG